MLTGPRQAGKTTLLRRVLGDTHAYVSLEEIGPRRLAIEDPVRFMATYEPPVVIDEVQHAPELMSLVKARVDERRHTYGQYVLSGSQNLLLNQRVTESLAGRVDVLELSSLTFRERSSQSMRPFPWQPDPADAEPESGAPDVTSSQDFPVGGGRCTHLSRPGHGGCGCWSPTNCSVQSASWYRGRPLSCR